jgi:hypothetical protein
VRACRADDQEEDEDGVLQDTEETEDHFLRKLAMEMLDTITLRGIADVPRVLIEEDKLYHKMFDPDDPNFDKYKKQVRHHALNPNS